MSMSNLIAQEMEADVSTRITIPWETYKYKHLFGPIQYKIYELALRPQGMILDDLQGISREESSSVARNLFVRNLLARYKEGRLHHRFFVTTEAMQAYMQSNRIQPWRAQGRAREILQNKASTVAFSEEATVDYSKAKVTVAKTPNLPTFTTVYDPNEKGRTWRYSNNLATSENK